jgi:hypothetical protein
MSDSDSPLLADVPAASPPRTRLGLWLFIPVFVFGAVRFGLRWWVDRDNGYPWPPLQAASDPDALLHGLMTGAAVLLLLLALAWGLWHWAKPHPARRRGLGRVALVVWVLVWLLGAVQAVYAHVNRTQLGELGESRQVTLSVMGAQTVMTSTRAIGGLRLYLDWPEQGGLHTLLIESPSEDLSHRPAALTLTLAPGRWQGWFVRAWQITPVSQDAERQAP